MKRPIYRRTLLNFLLPCYLLLWITGCKKSASSNIPQAESANEERLYVSFNFGSSSFRAQADTPTANEDQVDFEDKIDRLYIALFDASTGMKVAEKTTDLTTFNMVIKPGNYDVCVLANYPPIPGFNTKNNFMSFVKKIIPDNHHIEEGNRTTTSKGFPMARIFLNQQFIADGSSVFNPTPFHPIVPLSNPLSPISSIGNDWQMGLSKDEIRLVRAFAKISLTLSGEGADEVKTITYKQAANGYSMAENQSLPYGKKDIDVVVTNKQATLYVPERLYLPQPSWTADATGTDANYLLITMKSGTTYQVPVLFNGPTDNTYLKFAEGKTANFNVVRNHEYRFALNIPTQTKDLGVRVKVLPWNLKQLNDRSHVLVRAIVNVDEIRPQRIKINHEGTPVIQIYPDEKAIIPVKIIASKNALIVPTITNGAYFNIVIPKKIVATTEDGGYTNIEIKCKETEPSLRLKHATQMCIFVDYQEALLEFQFDSHLYKLIKGNRLIIQQIY